MYFTLVECSTSFSFANLLNGSFVPIKSHAYEIFIPGNLTSRKTPSPDFRVPKGHENSLGGGGWLVQNSIRFYEKYPSNLKKFHLAEYDSLLSLFVFIR